MRLMSDRQAHIYLLTDSTGIRYVGVSVNPAFRLKHHRYESLDATRSAYHFPKSRWLRKVGGEVRVRVLWTGTEAECYRREASVIAECRRRGHALLNIAEGGHRPPRINALPDADDIRAKISRAATGRIVSQETRRRMGEAHKGKSRHLAAFRSSEANPRKRAVRCYLADGTLVETYGSGRAAARAVGVSPCSLSDALNGRSKTCAGYTWRFAT